MYDLNILKIYVHIRRSRKWFPYSNRVCFSIHRLTTLQWACYLNSYSKIHIFLGNDFQKSLYYFQYWKSILWYLWDSSIWIQSALRKHLEALDYNAILNQVTLSTFLFTPNNHIISSIRRTMAVFDPSRPSPGYSGSQLDVFNISINEFPNDNNIPPARVLWQRHNDVRCLFIFLINAPSIRPILWLAGSFSQGINNKKLFW